MAALLFENGLLLDPEAERIGAGALLVDAGRILARLGPGEAPPAGVRRVDLGGRQLAPGFLDLHVHGRLAFAAPREVVDALNTDAASLARHGVTGFLVTTLAWEAPALAARVAACASWIDAGSWPGAAPLGIHLEGPWIDPRAAGAQPRAGIRPWRAAESDALFEAADGWIRMVTLAPEAEGADALLAELARRGVVAAMGHTTADDACVKQAIDRGLRHVTHLFNAMPALHHRQPGALGVALSDDRLTCDLICDGVHVHPDVVRLAARAKRQGLLLISDRIALPAGVSEGSPGPSFGSGPVRDDADCLRLRDGTLAGSNLTLDRAARNAERFGAMTRVEAIAACTLRPAQLLGIEHERGTLRQGARADLVVLDAEGRVEQTWIGGERVI